MSQIVRTGSCEECHWWEGPGDSNGFSFCNYNPPQVFVIWNECKQKQDITTLSPRTHACSFCSKFTRSTHHVIPTPTSTP